MKYIFQILFLCISISSFAQKQFVVDPNAEPRELPGSFTSIRVSGGVHVYLSQSENEGMAVSAPEDKYRDAIKTELQNGEIRISYGGERFHFGNNTRVNVYLAFKNIQQLVVSGASDVTIAGTIDLPLLNLQMSGASDLQGDIKIKELNVKLSGASDLKLTGTAGTVNIENSGASDVKSSELVADVCNIKSSGASDVSITVNKEIYANASGASSIRYKGAAEIKMRKESGASSVARIE